MDKYQDSVEKVRGWLDTNFDSDGNYSPAPDDARYYDKLPYLFHMVGDKTRGARVAQRVMERFIDDDGWLNTPDLTEEVRLYCMGWLALGAAMVERFDLAQAIADRLAAERDPESGVVPAHDDDAGEKIGDLCFSAGTGMAFVAAGRTREVRMLSDRLAAVIQAQLGERRMYTRVRRDGSVLGIAKDHEMDTRVYDLDGGGMQVPVYFATTVNVLAWASRMTRDDTYLKTARQLLDYLYRVEGDPCQSYRATKLGWAMLSVYEDTGDEVLLERARRMGDVHVSRQREDGLWDPDGVAGLPEYSRLSYSCDCAVTVCALANLPQL